MPTLTYLGPYSQTPIKRYGTLHRDVPVEVDQEWLDAHGPWDPTRFALGGDYEAPTADAGNDGIPDSGWRVADIKVWLKDNDVALGAGYKTKSRLLDMVRDSLNPVEEVVEVEETAPEAAAETLTEE